MSVGGWVAVLDSGFFGIWLSRLGLGFEEGEQPCDNWVAHLEEMASSPTALAISHLCLDSRAVYEDCRGRCSISVPGNCAMATVEMEKRKDMVKDSKTFDR